MSTDCLVNGVRSASISVDDRGLLYGDGLFETVAVRGGSPRFFDYHLERLATGCDRLGIAMPDSKLLREEVAQLIDKQNDATLRITLTRGSGPRGYAPPENARTSRVLIIYESRPRLASAYTDGIRLRSCSTTISVNPVTAGLKTLNRLEQVLARREWTDPDIDEGLMCTNRDRVICGTMSNLFYVSTEGLYTPDLSRCGIRGVMRRVVIEQALALGFDCAETVTTLPELHTADEIFMTNSQFGIWPVRRLDDWQYKPGPVTRTLMASLTRAGVEECRL